MTDPLDFEEVKTSSLSGKIQTNTKQMLAVRRIAERMNYCIGKVLKDIERISLARIDFIETEAGGAFSFYSGKKEVVQVVIDNLSSVAQIFNEKERRSTYNWLLSDPI